MRKKRWFWLNVKALAEEHQWRLKTFCALSDACVWHVCTLASFPRLHLWGAAPWRLLADPGGILQWISLLKITVWKSVQKVSLYNIASEASFQKLNCIGLFTKRGEFWYVSCCELWQIKPKTKRVPITKSLFWCYIFFGYLMQNERFGGSDSTLCNPHGLNLAAKNNQMSMGLGRWNYTHFFPCQ